MGVPSSTLVVKVGLTHTHTQAHKQAHAPHTHTCDDAIDPLISQCTRGVQPHPVPQSNQSDSGQVRLIKPDFRRTHSHNITLRIYLFH